jgi:hypothetical protein
MKTILFSLILLTQPIAAISASFQNLGFDSANTNNLSCFATGSPPYVDCRGLANELLPAWQLSYGNNPFTFINVNLVATGLGGVASLYDARQTFLPTFGMYSLGLYPGPDIFTHVYTPQSLIQVGDVPADALSIHFINYGSPFELRANNIMVPLIYQYGPPTQFPDQRLAQVAGDISQFAGMNVELKFITLDVPNSVVNGIDSITFSSEAIPEPGILSLLGAGLLLLFGPGWLRRFRT